MFNAHTFQFSSCWTARCGQVQSSLTFSNFIPIFIISLVSIHQLKVWIIMIFFFVCRFFFQVLKYRMKRGCTRCTGMIYFWRYKSKIKNMVKIPGQIDSQISAVCSGALNPVSRIFGIQDVLRKSWAWRGQVDESVTLNSLSNMWY